MKPNPLPSIELLRSKFTYNPNTGELFGPRGTVLRTALTSGYLVCATYVNGERIPMLQHRVVWFLHHGYDPGEMQIDHINGDKSDNRIVNLRLATTQQNGFNQTKSKGIHWDTRIKRWRAQVFKDGKSIHVGNFIDEVAARAAVACKKRELFGEFSPV